MLIKEKLTVDGVHIGYTIEDDGITSPVHKKLLFSELYFHALIESGYKFFSYDPDTVEDKSGNLIVNIESREADDEEKSWFDLQTEQVITDCYSDAYCSKYYAHKKKSAIQFRTEPSYEINTREELIEYLKDQRAFFNRNAYTSDWRPLNFFVNPEALFSIDEMVKDSSIKSLMEVVLLRHRIRNWKEYRNLINWLMNQGVLENDNPTGLEFIQAYYSWGVDGIRDMCVDMKMKMNVDVNFTRSDEAIIPNMFENRTQEYIILDQKQYFYHKKIKEDISNIMEFNREPIALGVQGNLLTVKRFSDQHYKYKVMTAWVSHPSNRLYYQFYSDKDYVYQVKISNDKFVIFQGEGIVLMGNNFGINSISGDIYYSLEECLSEKDYYISNAALMKAFSIVKNRVKATPQRNNFEMLVSDGVSVPAALTSVCVDAYDKRDQFISNSRILGPNGKQLLTVDALSTFTRRIPEGVMDLLQVKDDVNVIELLDVINAMDNIDDTLEFQMDGISLNLAEYCAKLTFVQDVLNGTIIINNFGDGVISDRISSVQTVFTIILSCIYAEAGQDADKMQLLELIRMFDVSNFININDTFMYCDNSYKGYVKDFVEQRKARGNAAEWMFCTRIYQEISNAPASERRDYAMEVITVPSGEKGPNFLRSSLSLCVSEADMSGIDEEIVPYIKQESSFIAANLFFHILCGHVDKYKYGEKFVVALSTGIGVQKIKVTIPMDLYNSVMNYDLEAHRKIIPVFTYCQMEKLEHIDGFSWMLTNAIVSPWHVNPKKGFHIPKYNFMINYFVDDAFNNAAPALVEKMNSTEAKVDALQLCVNEDFVVKYDDFNPMPDATIETAGTIGQYLDIRIMEDIHLYKRRWILTAAEAKESGGILYRMLLKSDVNYNIFAEYYGENVSIDNEIVYDGTVAGNNYLMDMEPMEADVYDARLLGVRDNAKISSFSLYDFDYTETSRWDLIINNNFYPVVPYVIEGNIILMQLGDKIETINIRFLTNQQLMEFADKGICYQLTPIKYLFQSGTGAYVVEVLQ